VRSHDDPHPTRLADWIVEKMGGEGTPWTRERANRDRTPVAVAGGHHMTVHDRSSAHHAAWMSLKRAPEVSPVPAAATPSRRPTPPPISAHRALRQAVGRHFELDDARVWMRLMFWAAREAGLMAHSRFAEWYTRFIAHFVRVYERAAPPFARESARWSADPGNLARYAEAGNAMPDVEGVTRRAALAQLSAAERDDAAWPYG
jgi:hypothetical protein